MNCIDHSYSRDHTILTLNQKGVDRIKSALEGAGIYITNPRGSGLKISDPFLGGGCTGSFDAYMLSDSYDSGTCPEFESTSSMENDNGGIGFCFPSSMSGPLKPDDDTGSSFSKTGVNDLAYEDDEDCMYGVIGTQEVSIHKVWEVKVTKIF